MKTRENLDRDLLKKYLDSKKIEYSEDNSGYLVVHGEGDYKNLLITSIERIPSKTIFDSSLNFIEIEHSVKEIGDDVIFKNDGSLTLVGVKKIGRDVIFQNSGIVSLRHSTLFKSLFDLDQSFQNGDDIMFPYSSLKGKLNLNEVFTDSRWVKVYEVNESKQFKNLLSFMNFINENYGNETYSAKEVCDYIKKITPRDSDIPDYFIKIIMDSGSTFSLKWVNIEEVLERDPDAKEYVENSESRYSEEEIEDKYTVDLPIVIFKNQVFDGYSRIYEKIQMGESEIEAYVSDI